MDATEGSNDFRYEAFRVSLGRPDPPLEPLKMDSLQSIPLAYATCSIGCKPEHTLPQRLDAIANAGFQAVELSMPDLVSFANMHLRTGQMEGGKEIGDHDWDDLLHAAKVLKAILDAKNLKVYMLQPFANFEGWPEGSPEHKDAWDRAEHWSQIMQVVDCDMLQIGSTDSPAEKIGKHRSRFVKDLREIADKLAERGQRIAYENWCWSTHAPDWEDVWDICQKVDRRNFGLCLDTFQSAGGEWADPTTQNGMIDDGRTPEKITADWKKSCSRLARTIPADKIYVLQISDAYKPHPGPIERKDVNGLRPKAQWSSSYRPLPFEGYLPVIDFTTAILQTGFRGWFSYEIFDSGRDGKGRDHELGPWAKAAMECHKKLMEEVSKQS